MCSKGTPQLIIIRSVATGFGRHSMRPPAANDTGTALGQDDSNWSHDLVTLTFDLGGHGSCGWCGLLSSIRVPSLKFVGLAIQKIRRTMCASINGPGMTLTFDLETGIRVASKVENLRSEFGHARPSGSRVIRYVPYATDGQKQAYCPIPYGQGSGIITQKGISYCSFTYLRK